MMKNYNTIYQRVNQFLFKKGYNPIVLKNNGNYIETVLFADYTKKIVFAVSLKIMDDMLYLLEGALFYNSFQKSISCGEWRACSIPYNNDINIDGLISQFESGFDQFMSDADDFVEQDSNVEFAEMKFGIILDDPDSAICKYAERFSGGMIIENK